MKPETLRKKNKTKHLYTKHFSSAARGAWEKRTRYPWPMNNSSRSIATMHCPWTQSESNSDNTLANLSGDEWITSFEQLPQGDGGVTWRGAWYCSNRWWFVSTHLREQRRNSTSCSSFAGHLVGEKGPSSLLICSFTKNSPVSPLPAFTSSNRHPGETLHPTDSRPRPASPAMTEAPGTLETISGSTMAHQAKPLQKIPLGFFDLFWGSKNPPHDCSAHPPSPHPSQK